jgi:hypothetical protein
VWQPKRIWRFADEQAVTAAEARDSVRHFSSGQIAQAWIALRHPLDIRAGVGIALDKTGNE